MTGTLLLYNLKLNFLIFFYQSKQLTYYIYAVPREPTVSPLGCLLEGRQSALVLEGQESTIHCRNMGRQYENPSFGTNLIHDFTAVTFSAKLAFFREKRRFP